VALREENEVRLLVADELREQRASDHAAQGRTAVDRVDLRRAVLAELRRDRVGIGARVDRLDGVADLARLGEQLERRRGRLAVLAFGVDPYLRERHLQWPPR